MIETVTNLGRVAIQSFAKKHCAQCPLTYLREKRKSNSMKNMRWKTFAITALVSLSLAILVYARDDKDTAHGAGMAQPMFVKYADIKWEKILPDLGADSPEISILRVDPNTKATQLMIRTSKGIHVRKHWHSANETHTILIGTATMACDGKRSELAPGSFNFMPAKMVHEAWLPAGSLTFITVDGAWDVNWVEGAPTAADLTK